MYFEKLIALLSLGAILVQAELYSAIAEMEDALKVERVHIDGLELYVQYHERQLQFFKEYNFENTLKFVSLIIL